MRVARATAPLRQRDFRLVWRGQTISLAGDSFHAVALAWLVLQLTASAAALGGVLAARAAVATTLLLVGGAVVDRLSPRMLMIVSAAARCALVTALTFVVAAGHATIWQVLAIEVAFGAADAFSLPAEGSIAPTLLPSHQLEAASALSSISENLSRLAGPVLAGAVVAGFGVLVIACGAAWALIAVAPIPMVAVVLIVVAGAADGVAEAIAPAWVQRQAQPRLLGRVMSVLEAARMIALPPSLIVFGLLASHAIWAVFAAGGVVYGLSAVVLLRIVPGPPREHTAAAVAMGRRALSR